MAVEGGDVREMIDFVNTAGVGAIGTIDDAAAQVSGSSTVRASARCCCSRTSGPTRGDQALVRAHRPARHAGLPGPGAATLDAKARATDTRTGYAEQQNQAVAHMTEKYEREVAAGRG
jgi:limonene 1,2-monooxygenase